MNLILRISRDNNRRRTLGLSATFAWCWVFPVTIVARGEFHCRTSVTVYESLLIYLCPHIEKKKGLGCFLFPKPCYMYQSLYHNCNHTIYPLFCTITFFIFFFFAFSCMFKKIRQSIYWLYCILSYIFNCPKIHLQFIYETKLAFLGTDKILVWRLYKHMTVYSHRSTIHLVCKSSLCTDTHLKTKTKKSIIFHFFWQTHKISKCGNSVHVFGKSSLNFLSGTLKTWKKIYFFKMRDFPLPSISTLIRVGQHSPGFSIKRQPTGSES